MEGFEARVVVDLGPQPTLRPRMWLWIEARDGRQPICVTVERVEGARIVSEPLRTNGLESWVGRRVSTAE